MDRFNRLINEFENSVRRLNEAYDRAIKLRNTEEYSFYRDSAIQRFEFTFEVMWKTIKAYLEKEGISCRSPRNCIRELFSVGTISEELARALLKMIEDRNLTVHTYNEEIAEDIFLRLDTHITSLKKLLEAIKL